METVELYISSPIISGSAYFKYRFRVVGGSYGAYFNEASNTITESLAPGDYEFEITYVNEEETECTPPVVKTVPVRTPFSCPTFDAEIIQSGALYVLQITYSPSSPATSPPCGWQIIWSQVGAGATVPYSSLPTSGVINITLGSNNDVDLTIISSLCAGDIEYCFEDEVPKIAEPSCESIIINEFSLSYLPSNNQWTLTFSGIQSTPDTPIISIQYQELSAVNPGDTPDSGFYSFPGVPAGQAFTYALSTLKPRGAFLNTGSTNPHEIEYVPNCIIYQVGVTDSCGVSHTLTVSGLWAPPPTGVGVGTFTPNGC